MEKFCSQCGTSLNAEQRFCASCGKALTELETSPTSQDNASAKGKGNASILVVEERPTTTIEVSVIKIAVGVALGLLMVLAGVYGVPWAAKETAKAAYEDAKISMAGNDALNIRVACEQYLLQKNDQCPRTTEDLHSAGVIYRVQKDPWGEDFVINCPGEHGPVDVVSNGPDRKPGGGDDIGSWERH